VVRNVPGAEGITAMNYVVQQVAPDGYTIVTGSSTTADPMNYRKPQSHFDATSFPVVGGVGRGGSAILINKEAEPRLYDKQARPVVMGSPAGVPRSGMQMTAWGAEFLGWNTKWVIGYRGTSDVFLALERGEIDMTATGNLAPVAKLLATGQYKILVQTGARLGDGAFSGREDFGDAPLIPVMVDGKIKDPVAQEAFDYWLELHSGAEKWLALPPDAPMPTVAVYRDAFDRMVQDKEFSERSKVISDDFTPIGYRDVESWMKSLGGTSDAAINYISDMMRRQGARAE
jgi:hypothetical protein